MLLYFLRPWLPQMYEKLTKEKARELRLSSKGLFHRKQRASGKKVVIRPQWVKFRRSIPIP